MDKKIIIGIIAAVVIILGLFLVIGNISPEYPDNDGLVSATDSNVTLKYNNDKSGTYSYGDNGAAYYENKILDGSLKIDINQITWESSSDSSSTYTTNDGEEKTSVTDPEYAKENVATDLSNGINNNNVTTNCEIIYYDANDTIIDVTDYSKNSYSSYPNVLDNITISDNTLTLDLHKNYQQNTTTPISNSASYEGKLLGDKQSDVHKVDHAKLTLTIYNDDFRYTIEVKLDGDAFTLEHM